MRQVRSILNYRMYFWSDCYHCYIHVSLCFHCCIITIGDRAFAVAGPRAWNSLPRFVIDCSSPGTLRKYLKTYLFSLSF